MEAGYRVVVVDSSKEQHLYAIADRKPTEDDMWVYDEIGGSIKPLDVDKLGEEG